MRRTDFCQLRFDEFDFVTLFLGGQFATESSETVIDEIGINYVGFAIITDFCTLARLPGFPHLAAIHAELAGKAVEFGQIVERRIGAGIVEREQIHQIKMARVVAADVVIPLEIALIGVIAIAEIPIARRADAVQHAAIMQHRQVKTAAIPGNNLRCEFLDTIEEALNDFAFALRWFGQ